MTVSLPEAAASFRQQVCIDRNYCVRRRIIAVAGISRHEGLVLVILSRPDSLHIFFLLVREALCITEYICTGAKIIELVMSPRVVLVRVSSRLVYPLCQNLKRDGFSGLKRTSHRAECKLATASRVTNLEKHCR